jgi:hypothetical protein
MAGATDVVHALASPIADDMDPWADVVSLELQDAYRRFYQTRLWAANVSPEHTDRLITWSLCHSCTLLAPGTQTISKRPKTTLRRPTLQDAAAANADFITTDDGQVIITARGLLMSNEMFNACLATNPMSETYRTMLLHIHKQQRTRLQRKILQQRIRILRAAVGLERAQQVLNLRHQRRESLLALATPTTTTVGTPPQPKRSRGRQRRTLILSSTENRAYNTQTELSSAAEDAAPQMSPSSVAAWIFAIALKTPPIAQPIV